MIALEITPGNYLDLYPDTQIQIKRNNPLFGNGNLIPGEYTLPFDIPLTDHNAPLLLHPDVIENQRAKATFRDVTLWFDGLQVKTGQLVLSAIDLDNKKASANLKFGLSSVAEQLKSANLKDISNEVIQITATNYKKTISLTLLNKTGESSLTINGVEVPFEITALVTPADTVSVGIAVNQQTAEHNVKATYVSSQGSEDPFGSILLENENDPLNVDTELLVEYDPEFFTIETNYANNFNAFNTQCRDYLRPGSEPDDTLRFPVYINQRILNLSNGPFGFRGGRGRPRALRLNYGAFNPTIKLSYVLHQLAAFMNVRLTGTLLATTQYQESVIISSQSITRLLPFYRPFNFENPFRAPFIVKEMNVSDYLPDLSLNAFIKALKVRFGLSIRFDEKKGTLSINTIKSLVERTATDITHKMGFLEDVAIPQHQGIIVEAEKNDQDTRSTLDQYTQGSPEFISRKTKIASTLNVNFGNVLTVSMEREEPKSLMLAQIQNGRAVRQTLQSLSELLNPEMRMLLRGRQVRAKADFTAVEILNLDLEQKQRIDQVEYLIKEATITLTMTGIRPVDCTLMSIG